MLQGSPRHAVEGGVLQRGSQSQNQLASQVHQLSWKSILSPTGAVQLMQRGKQLSLPNSAQVADVRANKMIAVVFSYSSKGIFRYQWIIRAFAPKENAAGALRLWTSSIC